MTQFTKNTQIQSSQTQSEREALEIQNKAKSIIEGVYSPSKDTGAVQKSVEEALSGNVQQAVLLMEQGDFNLFHFLPQSLRDNADIALPAVKMYPHIYVSLSHRLKNTTEIKKQALLSGLDANDSIISLIDIVESDKKSQKNMRKFLLTHIEKREDYPTDAWSKSLLEIYIKDTEIYKTIIGRGLLQAHQSGVSLGSRFTGYLSSKKTELETDSIEKTQELIRTLMLEFLEITNIGKYPRLGELLSLIAGSIDVVPISKQRDEELSEQTPLDTDESDLGDDDYQYHGPYRVSQNNNNCTLCNTQGKSIVVEQSIYNSMSEKSLINYMNFSLKMREIGLGFLLEKHGHKIQIATGINFFAGEGMSAAKTLGFLNKIAKRLGVPESSYEDEQGNREVTCFNELGAAYFTFREIASTGKIASYNFDVAKRGNNSIVEIYMKTQGIINASSGDFSILTFQKT